MIIMFNSKLIKTSNNTKINNATTTKVLVPNKPQLVIAPSYIIYGR